MSSTHPRPCLKPSIRNPWVCEEAVGSSGSSEVIPGCASVSAASDALAEQYATPFQPSTIAPPLPQPPSTAAYHVPVSLASAGLPLQQHLCLRGHSGNYPAPISSTQALPFTRLLETDIIERNQTGGAHPYAITHSQSASQSLHGATLPTQALKGPTRSATWAEPRMVWGRPSADGAQNPRDEETQHVPMLPHLAQGVFTVSGEPSNLPSPSFIQVPSGSAFDGTGNATGFCGVPVVDTGRCYQCNLFCFRVAQVLFVIGVVTGFSLLVVGGIYHQLHVDRLHVLIYIGALVSLVCLVLLIIFCAVNRNPKRLGHRLREGRQGDPEAVPLRIVDPNTPSSVDQGICPNLVSSEVPHSRDIMQCFAQRTNHNWCPAVSANHIAFPAGAPHQNVCFSRITNPNVSNYECSRQTACQLDQPKHSGVLDHAKHGSGCLVKRSEHPCVVGTSQVTAPCVIGSAIQTNASLPALNNKSLEPTSHAHHSTTVATQLGSLQHISHSGGSIGNKCDERQGEDINKQNYCHLWKQANMQSSSLTGKHSNPLMDPSSKL